MFGFGFNIGVNISDAATIDMVMVTEDDIDIISEDGEVLITE